MSGIVAVPSYKELLWPTLRAVREIGDSETIEELVEKVIALEGFTEEQQAVPHSDGPGSEIEYRLATDRRCGGRSGVLQGPLTLSLRCGSAATPWDARVDRKS